MLLRKRILNISLHINTIPEKNLLATYGDLLALRFGSWATALNYSGYVDYKGPALNALPLERTAIFQEEYNRLSEQHVKDKDARKKQAKENRREQKSAKKREKKAAAAGDSK